MDIVFTILNQVGKMFFLMIVGYFAFKKKWISETGTQQISNVLLKICTPAILMASFDIPFSIDKLVGLVIALVLGVISLVVSIIVAKFVYRGDYRIEEFSLVFSNCAFIGIPLVQGVLGMEAVFYLSAYLLAFYIFAWTYGVYLISKRRDLITLKLIVYSPAVIGTVLGLFIFFFPYPLPEFIMHPIVMIGNVNTPMAMIVLGCYIANTDLVSLLKDHRIYLVCFYRLILVPLAITLVFCLVPNRYLEIKNVVLIAASAPVGVMVALFAQQYKHDFEYGARIVSLSTILCMITIPIVLVLSDILWSL